MLEQGRCFLISSKQVWMLGQNVETNFYSSSKFGFETKGLSFTYRAWSQLTRCLENLVLPHSNLLSGCDCRYMIYHMIPHIFPWYCIICNVYHNMIQYDMESSNISFCIIWYNIFSVLSHDSIIYRRVFCIIWYNIVFFIQYCKLEY